MKLTIKQLRQMIMNEMKQQSFMDYAEREDIRDASGEIAGISDTGIGPEAIHEKFLDWKFTTDNGKKEFEEDWFDMSQGMQVDVWDYDHEAGESVEVSLKDQQYPGWSNNDFKILLRKVDKWKNK